MNKYLEKIASTALVRAATKGLDSVHAIAKGNIRKAGKFSTMIATKTNGANFGSKGTLGMLADNRSKLAQGHTSLNTAKDNVRSIMSGDFNKGSKRVFWS